MPVRLLLTPLVWGALLLGACAAEPMPPDMAEPDLSVAPAEATPTPSTSAAAPDTTDLPADLAACLPEAVRQQATAMAETARASDGGATYVVVEWTDAGDRAALVGSGVPVVLQLDDGDCTTLLPTGTDVTVEDVVPDAVAPLLSERRLDWRIAEAGGPDAYAALLRDRHAGRLVECSGPTDGWTDCLAPLLAERLRAHGVVVDRP